MKFEEALLFLLPVLIGVLLLWASSWARRRNAELGAKGSAAAASAYSALQSGDFKRAFDIYVLGDLSPQASKLGRALSFLVVLLVSSALVALFVVVLYRLLHAS